MSTHLRAVGGSDDGDVPRGPLGPDADLMDRIDRALRSRAVATPDAAVVAARIEDRLATLPTGTGARRGAKIVVAGVVTSTLAVVGAGAAAASDPYSNVARVVESAVQAVGVNWSPMPDGYTRAQHDAFWAAGYALDDAEELSELWSTDVTETKARAGQMILDGTPLPLSTPPPIVVPSDFEEFGEAGYTYDDAVALAGLWGTEVSEAKAMGGRKVRDGEELPIPPSGTPEPDVLEGPAAPGVAAGGR